MVMYKQTEDQASLMKWVKAVQTCNEEGHVQKVGVALMGVVGYRNVGREVVMLELP